MDFELLQLANFTKENLAKVILETYDNGKKGVVG
jgi:hypothetical protein